MVQTTSERRIQLCQQRDFGIYVDLWCKLEETSGRMCGVPDEELPHLRLISFDDGRWLAADNIDLDCWVEEFQCRSNAKAYLNNEAIDLDTLFCYDAAGVAINFKRHYSSMCGEY